MNKNTSNARIYSLSDLFGFVRMKRYILNKERVSSERCIYFDLWAQYTSFGFVISTTCP
jgi:hypothetical protein